MSLLPPRLPLWILVVLLGVGLGIEGGVHGNVMLATKVPLMVLLAWGLLARPSRLTGPSN